ncbi:MAG TPA: tetratricopeptide repeat protein [Holophagaceae bacterium]|nr:tetratricopeptide repeat protein [Holophagaceae bacterium]
MNRKALMIPAIAAALVCVGCNSDDQMQRVEQEVGDLKVEVFKLRQQTEEANKKAEAEAQAAEQARAEDRRFRADLQETLRQVQDASRTLSNKVGSLSKLPPVAQAAATPSAPMGDDEKAFNSAMLDYNKGNYSLASDGFGVFLKAYPQSARRADALFFSGLCQYNQKAYDKAQVFFDQIIKELPTSNQFLPSKLKRGQCLLRLGLKPAAIRAFKELSDGFPGTSEARTAQQELADLGL